MADDNYTDDSSIPNDAALWRRVHPAQIVYDDTLGRRRPSSAAFSDHPNGTPMSVFLAQLVWDSGRMPHELLLRYQDYGLASITAGGARRCGQGVAHEPLPNEPAHAVVFGKKTKSVSKKLAEEAARQGWVVEPPSRE